ncbi:response regulator transcription factor [Microbacterium paludicola]|uniref:response regulator transcription factor n=1 Tax=Microbacterium paludicola TaxID=300019 RepID=UPI0031D48617
MRILICEDSVLLREGLVRLLEDGGHTVVAALPDATGLPEAVDETDPELCIVDVRLPPTFTDEGIRAAVQLRSRRPELPVLVLSQYVEERYASELIASQAAPQAGASRGQGGALGYLLKDRVADVREFLDSIERIGQGATVLDPEVVAQLLTRRHEDDRMSRLTERERTVLALIAEGKSNQAIAGMLFLSEGSVEKNITAIFQKLGLEPDESGNRRVLAALAHIESSGGSPQTGTAR